MQWDNCDGPGADDDVLGEDDDEDVQGDDDGDVLS